MGVLEAIKVEVLKVFLSIAYWTCSLLPSYDKHAVLLLSSRSDSMSIGMSMISEELAKVPSAHLQTFFYSRHETQLDLLRDSLKAVKLIANSRVIVVDDHCFPLNALYGKRKRNVTFQIWHAVGGHKKFGNAKQSNTRIPHKNYDYVCVNSKQDIYTYASAFGVCPEQVKVTGALQIQYIEELMSTINISDEKNFSTIFFAPTYRTGGDQDFSVSMMKELIQYFEESKVDAVLKISLHPYISEEVIPEKYRFDRNDFYKILLNSDVLITDYSSLVIDYSITRRPIVLWTPDLVEYTSRTGFFDGDDITKGLVSISNLNQLESIIGSKEDLGLLSIQETEVLDDLADLYFTGADSSGNTCRLIIAVLNEK